MESVGAQSSVVATVASIFRAFKQPRPATYLGPTNVDLTARETTPTSISALAARLVGELIAKAGDDSSELRAPSIRLSARLCAVAKCLEEDALPTSNNSVLLRLDEELLYEIERVVTVRLSAPTDPLSLISGLTQSDASSGPNCRNNSRPGQSRKSEHAFAPQSTAKGPN